MEAKTLNPKPKTQTKPKLCPTADDYDFEDIETTKLRHGIKVQGWGFWV